MVPMNSLKLLVDNKTNKVLFAEASNEFVDFVFHFLRLRIGAVMNCVSAATMPCSMGRLYQSVANMRASYLLPGADKILLSQGRVDASTLARSKMYTCAGQCVTVSMEAMAECPHCRKAMGTEMTAVIPSSAGYVKGEVTYMVTDGLEVTPMSAISSFALISWFSAGKEPRREVGHRRRGCGSCVGLPPIPYVNHY